MGHGGPTASRVRQDAQAREIPAALIGERVMGELEKLDGVAYVRFASVYREFRDVRDFINELKDFLNGKEDVK